MGSDLLTTLQAATKGLSVGTGLLSDAGLLGPTLALEAGSRYGPAIVGAGASLIGRLGQGLTGAGAAGLGGILGSAGHAATAEEAAGMAGVAEGDIIGAGGIAGALGGLGPLDIGAIAAGTYLVGKGLTYKTPQQQQIAAAQTAIGQDSFTTALGAILSQVNQLAPTASQPGQQGYFSAVTGGLGETFSGIKSANLPEAIGGLGNFLGSLIGVTSPTDKQAQASGAIQQLTGQYTDLLNAGQQIASVFKVSIPEAFQLANQSGLQLATALGPNGKLTAVALQQVANAQTGIARMTGGIGSPVYNAATGAVQIGQGLAGSQLSTVNSAYDQLVQNAAGGTSGATGFAGALQALQTLGASLPAAQAQAEIAKLSPAATQKSAADVAKALTGFSSPASQAAWSAFSSTSTTSPGLLQNVESMMDQLRTAQTSGVLSQGQVAGAGAYEAKQLLPYAKQSPAALAQLGIISQEIGGPAYQAGKSQAQNFAAISGAIDKASDSAKGYTATQNTMAIGMSDISSQAESFSSVLSTDLTNSMAAGVVGLEGGNKAMTSLCRLSQREEPRHERAEDCRLNSQRRGRERAEHPAHDEGCRHGARGDSRPDSRHRHPGRPGSGHRPSAGGDRPAEPAPAPRPDAAGLGAPLSPSDIAGNLGLLAAGKTPQLPAPPKPPPVDYTSKVTPPEMPPPPKPPPVDYTAKVAPVTIPAIPPKDFTVKGHVDMPPVPNVPDKNFGINGHVHMPAIPHVPDQSFTITGHIVMVGGTGPGGAPGVSPLTPAGIGAAKYLGQSGFKVPGTGSGDIVPAMLEPGELVVPKSMVAAGSVDHLRGRIPGFASGGMVGDEFQSTLTRASAMIGNFSNSGGNLNAQQWGQMSGTFMQAAQLAHVMGQSSGFASGGIVPDKTLAGIKAQIDAAYAKLDALYAANSGKGDAATSAFWANTLDPLYSAEDKLEAGGSASSSSSSAASPAGGKAPYGPIPSAAAQKVFDSFEQSFKGMGNPWGQLASQILEGLTQGLKNAPQTAKAAEALVSKVTTEINFGKNLASSTVSGLGLGSMQVAQPTKTSGGAPYQYYIDQASVAAGGQPTSVQGQMGDYLQAIKSFQGDVGALSKGGLSKGIMSQLLSAGPIQGDALAQSILGGAGGIKGANQLYSQIQAASTKLGVSGMTAMYGMPASAQPASTASRSAWASTPTPQAPRRRSTPSMANR